MPSLLYASAGVNRSSHILDSGIVSLLPAADSHSTGSIVPVIAYASHKSVVFWEDPQDPESQGITSYVHVAKAPITALRFITRPASAEDSKNLPYASTISALVVGSADGSVHLLKSSRSPSTGRHNALRGAKLAWEKCLTLPAKHAGSISTIAVIKHAPGSSSSSHEIPIVIVTGGSDGKLRAWWLSLQPDSIQVSGEPFEIDLGGPFPLAASLSFLPGTKVRLLLAVGITQRRVAIFVQKSEGRQFTKAVMLEGHEDWVRSLDICTTHSTRSGTSSANEDLMLATASQDSCTRLWRIKRQQQASLPSSSTSQQKDAFEALAEKLEDDRLDDRGISTKAHPFTLDGVPEEQQSWSINFDALLVGHDGWVNDVRWALTVPQGQPAALLSAGADGSCILWEPSLSNSSSTSDNTLSDRGIRTFAHPDASSDSALWMPSARFGEVGGVATGGFYGCVWLPRSSTHDPATALLAHAWNGATHLFRREEASAQGKWTSAPSVGGHQGAVRGIDWEPQGKWFLTAGADRTTRLHGRYCRDVKGKGKAQVSWHEIARPQTHGYDLNSVAWMDRFNFVSAADEKIVRVFSAPRGFIGTVQNLRANAQMDEAGSSEGDLVLLVTLPQLLQPECLQGPLQEVSSKLRPRQRLSVIIISPAFDDFLQTDAEFTPTISFEQVETFLKWTYAQCWKVAVKNDRLDVNIDVLVMPQAREQDVSNYLAPGDADVEAIFTVKGLEPPSSLAGRKVSVLQPSSADHSSDSTVESNAKSFARHRAVALGGTFDHLHVGHKILLSMASLVCTERIIVGVTTDVMLKKKSNAHLLEPLSERLARVDGFIRRFRSAFFPVKQDVVELSDVAGPAGTEADLQALVVTDETVAGADMIDKERQKKSLGTLERYVIGVIGAEGETDVKGQDAAELAASKIGSTAIRKWLAEQPQQATTDSLPEEADRPIGASVPPLGLSNRAVFEGNTIEEQPSESGQLIGTAKSSVSAAYDRPPTESELVVTTLWPELDKLYGHGYETLSVAASPDGRFCASSCKSTSPEHALIRLHDRKQQWKGIGALPGHALSVTRLRFSSDGGLLLTVSRDRSWRLYKRPSQGNGYEEATSLEKAHARILWDAAWFPSGERFVTVSRDKTAKVWAVHKGGDGDFEVTLESTVAASGPATAVAVSADQVLAIGLENGEIRLFRRDADSQAWTAAGVLIAHTEAIAGLQFRPGSSNQLLSAGEDGLTQLTNLQPSIGSHKLPTFPNL